MEMDDKLYDNVLIGILQKEGEISGFLDAVLGFLYRRTDYFRIMKTKTDKMGFTPGTALNLLIGAFKKYERIALEDEKKKEKLLDQKKRKQHLEKERENAIEKENASDKTYMSDTQAPPASEEVVFMPTGAKLSCQDNKLHNKSKDLESSSPKQPTQSNKSKDLEFSSPKQPTQSNQCKDLESSSPKQATQCNNTKSPQPTESNSQKDTGISAQLDNSKPEEKDEDPELARQQVIFQRNSDSYNGAIRDNYAWSQSITDLDVNVKIPNYIKKGKDINVCINKKHLKISYKDEKGNTIILVDDDLCWEINKDEAMWNLVPGEHILINIDKKQERWWEALLMSEPKISVRKIDASRPMTDLDDEAQAKIEEMMYNERQKRLGLPQSHETKVHDVLAQAWNAEGSPFKGQPFDPSKINVGQDGMVSINENDSNSKDADKI